MGRFPDVRRAKPDDQDRLGALWMAFLEAQAELDDRLAIADDALERWNNDFPVWLTDETQGLWVAAPEGTVVGFASAHRWGPPPIYAASSEVYLDEVYVDPAARRQGLGTQLVAAVRAWAESVAAGRIRLQMMAANDAAQAFWAAVGARPFALTSTIELDQAGGAPPPATRSIGFT